jgi:RNA polymerase sigma factor (sigma-70 family)
MDLSAFPDEGLIAKIQGDDPATARGAFEELFRRYFPRLTAYAQRCGLRSGAPSGDGEDVALRTLERVFLALAERRPLNLEETGSVRAFVHIAARNQARDALRQATRRLASQPRAELDLGRLPEPAGRSDAETDVVIRDFREALLARLQPRERQAAELLAGGCTTSEICARMGLSQPTLWRFRRRLEALVREMLQH